MLRKLEVIGFVHSTMKTLVGLFTPLSHQVRLALEQAVAVAGDGLASTEHLLYGLAEGGLEELTAEGLTEAVSG